MKLLTLNNKNEIVDTNNNTQYIAMVLLETLWNKVMKVTNDIKRIDYKYNCSNKQVVKVTFRNGYKYIFEDVPTHCCMIDIDELMKGGE